MKCCKVKLCLGVLWGGLLWGCGAPETEATAYEVVPIDGWDASKVLSFEVDSISTDGEYELSVGVRTSAVVPYEYRNLVLLLEVVNQKNDTIYLSKGLNCALTDADGDVNGKGVSLYEYLYCVDTLQLVKADTLQLCMKHMMKNQKVVGVANVGFVLRKL